jgi:hypothetical protein
MAYIAMELLEGHSLQQILKHPQRLAFNTTANIIAQVADALDLAQRFKIVHRDVKPANIMVDSAGRAKLTDFGVAYVPSSTMTQTGTALGSPRYMSPEQVLGQPVDSRSDIFSLGVVLYEMLTKRTPFERPEDTTVFALMNRIAGQPHVPLRQVDAQIPAAFEHILDRALAKKPEQRYQRAGEMAQQLRDFRNLQPRSAASAGGATVDEIDDTVPLDDPRANQHSSEIVRTQLINDLDKFAEAYDREEQERIKAAEAAQRKKEEDMRRWGEEQARKRDELERTQNLAASASPDITTSKGRALDFVRKQAGQPQRESPSLLRAKTIGELDGAMRSALQYLAELVREINGVHPIAERPYEFIYLGKLPKVSLSDAFVDSRPRTIEGSKVTDHVFMRFRITPSQPARATLLGDDIGRCEQYLKMMKVSFTQRAMAKNDFGKVSRAEVSVTGSLPCEVNVRADYDADKVTIELTNVRRLGRAVYQLKPRAFVDAVDDLARYMLGADDDFETVARAAK